MRNIKKLKINASIIIFIALILLTVGGIIAVSYAFYKETQKYTTELTFRQLDELIYAESFYIKNRLRTTKNLIGEIAGSELVINSLIDFRDSLPDNSPSIIETAMDVQNKIFKATKRLKNKNNLQNCLHSDCPPNYYEDITYILLNGLFIDEAERTKKKLTDITAIHGLGQYSDFHQKHHLPFMNLRDKYGFDDIMLIEDRTKRVIYTTNKEDDFGILIKNSKTFKYLQSIYDQTISSRKLIYSDFIKYNDQKPQALMLAAVPVYSGEKILGVLLIKLNSKFIFDHDDKVNSNPQIASSTYIYIDGKDGFNRKEINVSDFSDAENKNTNLYPSLSYKFEEFDVANFNKEKLSNKYYPSISGKIVMGSKLIIEFDQIEWIARAEVPVEKIEQFSQTFKSYVQFASILAILIVVPVAYFLAKILTRPIIRTVNFMHEIGQNNRLNIRLDNFFVKEVDDLSITINQTLAKLEISQNSLREVQNNLQDSLNAARDILQSRLPNQSYLEKVFNQIHIVSRPKDTVGGDLYWAKNIEDISYIACIDCTGHGVPGALISIMVQSAFENISNEEYVNLKLDSLVLRLEDNFIKQLPEVISSSFNFTGFAISIIKKTRASSNIEFIGLGHDIIVIPLVGHPMLIKGSKKQISQKKINFDLKTHIINTENSFFMLYTDGITTQVGRDKRQMLGNKRLLGIVEEVSRINTKQIAAAISDKFEKWMEDEVQRDDLTLIVFEF